MIKIKLGKHCRNPVELKKIFNELLLPMPKARHFDEKCSEFAIDSQDNQTYLTPFGVVIRIIYDTSKREIIRHPHILRPLAAITFGTKSRLDIQPAGATNKLSDSEVAVASKELCKEKIQVSDLAAQNFMSTAPKTVKFPNGIPVNFDPSKVITNDKNIRVLNQHMTGSNRLINLEPSADETPDFQDDQYGFLRSLFTNAHDSETDTLNPRKIINFWQTLAAAVEDKVLHPGWIDEDLGRTTMLKNSEIIAANYEKRLRAKSPIFA